LYSIAFVTKNHFKNHFSLIFFKKSLFGWHALGQDCVSVLNPSPPSLDWAATIWRQCIPPSHSIVFWRLMRSKLPTYKNLRAKGWTLVSICVICYKQDVTSSHLFLSCEFTVALWKWLGLKLNRLIPLDSIASLLACLPSQCSSQLWDVFVSAIVHTVHTIWLARNALRFGYETFSLHVAKAKIISMISSSGKVFTGNCISDDVTLLENFMIHPSYQCFREIISVVRKPPTFTWVKANTNGSIIASFASFGGIFLINEATFWAVSLLT